jgi:glucose/arabinose dehydrogenase
MRRLVLVVSPCIAVLTGCPGGGNSDGTGTDDTSTATEPSTTEPSTSETMTSTTVDPDTSATMTTSMTMTTTDTEGTESESSTTETGVLPCPYEVVDGNPAFGLQQIANGFDRPVIALGHPTEPDRLFVAEQGGAIKILEPGMDTAPDDDFLFIDVDNANNQFIGAETGLLGFAFHPNFPDDPRVYVAYSPAVGGAPPTRVSEFTLMDGDPNHADPASERIVIEGAQPFGNHNGGMIAFGPDGMLYFGLGDGGNFDDTPQQVGHNPGVILAKILRIDVEPDGTPDAPYDDCGNADCDNVSPTDFDYTIPADNPFVDDPAFAPETYAWGVRNPWRFAFDSEDGTMYMADVGQNQWEEVNVVTPGGDYGWSEMEGFHCFGGANCEELDTPNAVNADGYTMPLVEYSHGEGCSVTGGAVYRSCEVPAWSGMYTYGDYCSGRLYGLVWDGSAVTQDGTLLESGQNILGNGWNAYGDVFVTTVLANGAGQIQDGFVHRLAPAG